MCGIGGILRTDGLPIPEQWLDLIDERIAYRGPDGCGRFRDRVEVEDPSAPAGRRVVEVAFVHRRLSIIDHKDGAQPMVSQRGRNESEGLIAVVFNGCIYNHRELREELEGKGHRFVTDHSDTEVLIHGWREWNNEMIDHLEGMYAFAVWDRTNATLFLARDRFGEKPLYLRQRDGTITFSSEVSATTRNLLSGDAVQRYLQVGYVLYDIDEHVASGFGVAPSPAEEWVFINPTPLTWQQEPATEDRIDQLVEKAVAERLEADVPLGCFLSGGIDSSLIAHFARKHKPGLQTFCVRMPDARFDESAHAERVARHLGTDHHTLDVAMCPAQDLVHLTKLLGQPFGDSSILPTYWVSKAVRQHAKVALSGDGGDELFIGYERYIASRHLATYNKMLALIPSRWLLRAHPKSRLHKLGRLTDAARDYENIGLMSLESLFSLRDLDRLTGFDPDRDNVRLECCDQDDPLQVLRMDDIKRYLPDDLLRKVDTASMACGLEVRCPFLDRDLARAALSMPIDQLMPRGQRKGLLRRIARKYLPREIVDRPKMGFAIPIGEWFRNDDVPHKGAGMKSLLLDHLNSAEPFGRIELNRTAVQRFVDEHMTGTRDHGQRLFALLTLSIWARQHAAALGV